MGIMPRYPFGEIKPSELRLMIELDVIAGRVYVVERVSPIRINNDRDTLRAVGVMSWEKALEHVKTRLEDKKNLPIRVDVFRGPDGIELSEQLYRAVIELAKQAKIEKEADIRLPDLVRDASGEFVFTLIPGAVPRMQTAYLVRGRLQNSLNDNTPVPPRDVEFDKAEEYIAHRFAETSHFPAARAHRVPDADAGVGRAPGPYHRRHDETHGSGRIRERHADGRRAGEEGLPRTAP